MWWIVLYIAGIFPTYWALRTLLITECLKFNTDYYKQWQWIAARAMISLFSWPCFILAVLFLIPELKGWKEFWNKHGPDWL